MQHLLMGMNAHINLDLGIAASEVAGGNSIHDLKSDFMKVNDILAGLLSEIIKRPPGRIRRTVLQFISKFEEKDVKKITATQKPPSTPHSTAPRSTFRRRQPSYWQGFSCF